MVIYVEDNINNQRLLTRMLKKRHIETIIYDNPNDGFAGIMESNPEMVFLDVHLKTRMTGLDLAKKLRKAGFEKPIVVVTCFNMLADRQRAIDAGCNDYLSKPYQMSELLQIVDKYMTLPTA